jgi:hypothetical protein
MYQHLPLQDPPKFTQIWIFGFKTNHLATMEERRNIRFDCSQNGLFISNSIHFCNCINSGIGSDFEFMNIAGLPCFSLYGISTREKNTKWQQKYQPNSHILKCQMPIKYTNVPNDAKIYQHFPFQSPPKYTQTVIFGMKI